jgi:tetratricopeptide (TPR) repeat protein
MPPRPVPPPIGLRGRLPVAGRARKRAGSPPPPPPESEVALRLAIGREGIGIELARPARIDCVTVTDLAATLPGLRFPVDVSGGVPRFRHRRGELQRLELELGARAVERWAAPRLRGIVGTRVPDVWIGVRRAAAVVCVGSAAEAEEEPRAAPVLAFDVQALAEGDDLVLVVEQARGSDLPRTATALAVACLGALIGPIASREGAAFVVRGGAGAVARALLPEAGARAPSAVGVPWTSLAAAGDAWVLHAMHGAVAAAPDEQAVRAREVAMLLREADDVLVGGDEAAARALYVDALERAPRHPEIVRRIVDVDVRAGGRTEAALAMLVEARSPEAGGAEARFGTTPGELLAESGDVEGALASLERAGETEPTPSLAARAFESAGRLARDAEEAARWLDRSLARSPRSASARWLRVARRVELGRLEDATADVEHLEALARGGRAKHLVWLRAGRVWHAAGLASHAAALFERALRFVPDEPRALAGLGAALVGEGREARGVAVLERALELTEARGEPTGTILLDLGRALADKLGDLPAAIARVRAVAPVAREAPQARGLEGRWRAQLGDLAGAALAFARLRELAMSLPPGTEDVRAGVIVALLREAAELDRTRLRDALGAQRHLAAALRLRPRDAELLRAYREIGEIVARREVDPEAEAGTDDEAAHPQPAPAFDEDEERSATHRTTVTERPPLDIALAAEPDAGAEPDPEMAARIEELTRRIQADPRDDAVADELATLLEKAGRGHELLALLSARLEDATPERRAVLAPRARAALERLAADADAAGRHEEAALFRSVSDSLPRAP